MDKISQNFCQDMMTGAESMHQRTGAVNLDDQMLAIQQTIQRCDPLPELKEMLNAIGSNNKQVVTQWMGADGLDCMHHAILAGNTEAVMYFHLHGYFSTPHKPRCNDYLQLACYTGHTAIVGFLTEESQTNDLLMGHLCYPNLCTCEYNSKPPIYERTACMLTPLDAAAKGDQLRCVQLLLLSKFVRSRSRSLIERACIIGSSEALELILRKHPDISSEEKQGAVEEAIKRRQAKCLEILFYYGANIQGLFHGAHPLTVLFSASDGYLPYSQRNKHLLEVTKVLLDNGVTCSSALVKNTDYTTSPIATLIYQAMLKIWQFNEYSEEHFKCLELILHYKFIMESPEFCEILKNLFGYCPPEHFKVYSETVIQYLSLLLNGHVDQLLVVNHFHLLLRLMTCVSGLTGDRNVTENTVDFFQRLILLFIRNGADPDLGFKIQVNDEEKWTVDAEARVVGEVGETVISDVVGDAVVSDEVGETVVSGVAGETVVSDVVSETVAGQVVTEIVYGKADSKKVTLDEIPMLWFPVNEYIASIDSNLRISLTRYTDEPKCVHIILDQFLKPVALLAAFMKRESFKVAQAALENPVPSLLKVRHKIDPHMIHISGEGVEDTEHCDLQSQTHLFQLMPARYQSLVHTCRLCIWTAIGRKYSSIERLPIAPGLKKCLKEMFHVQEKKLCEF
ncbi:uncharacterized protein LOC106153185 [Lingula anatina]|uniref:Uncharacterized protein LOC106153185 n=1 Tax=Lingula anatina TaxID=7574 RepID=A0A1S3H8Y8_LINAN|nr:uncharacterized protein LOC106153185 [Lingula anatina]|eukprot:XP_013382478.1 uncharacterized protein LOC106153185 [Lingula anatina]